MGGLRSSLLARSILAAAFVAVAETIVRAEAVPLILIEVRELKGLDVVVLERVLCVPVEEDAVADLADMIDVLAELLRVGPISVRVVAQEESLNPGGDTRGVPVIPRIASSRI